jgi:hypothetical protein
MVKFLGKPQKEQVPHVAGETGVVQAYTAPERPSLRARWRDYPREKKNRAIGILMAIILATGIGIAYQHSMSNRPKVIKIPGEKQATALQVEKLEKNQPASSATLREKLAYYDKLTYWFAQDKQYQKAVDTFDTREALSPSGLSYVDYAKVAGYYHELNDNTSAQQFLTKAHDVLPAKDNFDAGYVRTYAVSYIEKLRKEYQ